MMSDGRDWEGVRLHIVTGKGGTGKTTVAAALSLALACAGQSVLLCEVEGRQGLARLFDVPQLPYDEQRLAVAKGRGDGERRGEVYGLAIDPEAALMEYLEMYYRLGRAGRLLEKVGAIDFATTIAPGVRDVLLTGKVYEAVRRKDKDARRVRGRQTYDVVVLDAPPTGRIARFLGVNAGVADIARVGPIRNQADSIMSLLRSPQTVVHLVTLLEEMPVQETADGIAELREAQIPIGGVVINMVRRTEGAPIGKPAKTAITAGLSAAGIEPSADLVRGLQLEARDRATRVALEDAQRERIAGLARPTYELPRLSNGLDRGALFQLADELTKQGMG
ncbi:P-loop NTPase family protein [Flindersiella endophytica]